MNWDNMKAFAEASSAVGTLIVRLASDAGGEIREHPARPGAVSNTIRKPAPLTGIRAAMTAQQAAKAVVRSYISTARSDGLTWEQIGDTLRQAGAISGNDLTEDSPYYVAVAAFEYAAGPAELFRDRTFGWTCPGCDKRVIDRGPYDGNPLATQFGHAAGCARLAAAIAEFEAAGGNE